MGTSDSKQEFQTEVETLAQKDQSLSEASYWQNLLSHPQSLIDVFIALTPSFLSRVQSEHPENIRALLTFTSKAFREASNPGQHTNMTINALRVTTRILSYLLELPEQAESLWEDNLAMSLIEGLTSLLFTEGFTISSDSDKVWKEMSGETLHSSEAELNSNRAETMHCLLGSFTQTLYHSLEEIKEFTDPWILTALSMPEMKDLFNSLLNVVLTYNNQGYIPFSGYLYEGEEDFTVLCSHLLLLLVDCKDESNLCTQLISEIADPSYFEYVLSNIDRLLGNVVTNKTSMIPSSVKSIEFMNELLLLFWHFIQNNEAFEDYSIKSPKVNALIDLLMLNIIESIEDPRHLGVLQLSSFIVLKLSSKREFVIKFSRKNENSYIPGEYYYDCLVIAANTIITTKPSLSPLFGTFMSILFNMSAYVKTIGRLGAQKFVGIFEHLTSSKVDVAEKENRGFIGTWVDAINNRLQYQWDSSIELVYALLSKKHIYERFMNIEGDEEWQKWKEIVPLNLLDILFKDLMRRLDSYIEKHNHVRDTEILTFLADVTMVGLFPIPHAIYVKKYPLTPDTKAWFTSFLWGIVFTRNQRYGLINHSAIKLFKVSVINN